MTSPACFSPLVTGTLHLLQFYKRKWDKIKLKVPAALVWSLNIRKSYNNIYSPLRFRRTFSLSLCFGFPIYWESVELSLELRVASLSPLRVCYSQARHDGDGHWETGPQWPATDIHLAPIARPSGLIRKSRLVFTQDDPDPVAHSVPRPCCTWAGGKVC